MARTILDLVKSALYRSNAQQIPTALVASTNSSDLQLLHLLYGVGEELLAMRCWPQLKRTFKVRLVTGQEGYDLPVNFFSLLPWTHYDRINGWVTGGPMTDSEWNMRVLGTDVRGVSKAFRFFGAGGRQFKVSPTPGDGDANTVISFDYICRDVFQPPAWTASEASIAQNIYRTAHGRIYKKTDSGSDTAGTNRPTVEFGEGQDGGVRWLALSTAAFQNTTLYKAGDYFLGSTRLYRVTVGGTTASTTPTSTTEGTNLTSGTVTYRYHSSPAWAGQTDYDTGDYVLISTQYYRCEVGGKSGSVSLTWTPTTEIDNTITWTFQDIAYDTVQLDTDFVTLDEELFIAGMRARLFLARGLGAEDLVSQYERMKQSALGRWNAGKILDLTGGEDSFGINLAPISNWTAV